MNDPREDPYFTEEPAQKELREKQDHVARTRELEDWRAVMSTAAGRRAMWRLLGRAGLFRTPFAPGESDRTLFNLGEHNLGLWVQGELLQAAIERFADMEKENRT